jgi:hypothetical protein
MGGSASRQKNTQESQQTRTSRYIISYSERVKQIVTENNWIQYTTGLDNFCSFYYDPVTKYLWVIQDIGNGKPLITKPSDEYLSMITRKYRIDVLYSEQPSIFYGF